MPAAKRKPRSSSPSVSEMVKAQAAMLSPTTAAEAPREVPTYDARTFDRFIKAVRELESAMDAMADIGCKTSVGSVANTIYSETDRRPIGQRYRIDYAINKENPRHDNSRL